MFWAHFDSLCLPQRGSGAATARHLRGITKVKYVSSPHNTLCNVRPLMCPHASFHKITYACVRHDLNQTVLEEQFLSILQCAQVADESWLVAGEESGGEGEE